MYIGRANMKPYLGLCVLAATVHASVAQLPESSPAFRGGPLHRGVYRVAGERLGGLAWRFPTAGDVISSPIVSGGIVYVGGGDGSLYAIDLASGKLRWRDSTWGRRQRLARRRRRSGLRHDHDKRARCGRRELRDTAMAVYHGTAEADALGTRDGRATTPRLPRSWAAWSFSDRSTATCMASTPNAAHSSGRPRRAGKSGPAPRSMATAWSSDRLTGLSTAFHARPARLRGASPPTERLSSPPCSATTAARSVFGRHRRRRGVRGRSRRLPLCAR